MHIHFCLPSLCRRSLVILSAITLSGCATSSDPDAEHFWSYDSRKAEQVTQGMAADVDRENQTTTELKQRIANLRAKIASLRERRSKQEEVLRSPDADTGEKALARRRIKALAQEIGEREVRLKALTGQ